MKTLGIGPGSGFKFLLVAAICCVLLAQPLMAVEGIKGNLVGVDWLSKNLKNKDIVLIDASPSQLYAMKHIPGAINNDIFVYGLQEKPSAEMEKRYQAWGVSPGKKIVLYDQGGTFFAARVLFSLDYFGYPTKDLYILDGGLSKWEATGLPVTKDPTPAPEKGTYKFTKLDEKVSAELPEFLNASGDTVNNVLLEALEPDWHYGVVPIFRKSGHIPRSTLVPSADFFNPDKTFKSPDEIRKMLTFLGIKPEQTIYSHCGGGGAASVPYFVLKFMLDYPNVKLYSGSELDWLSDERDLPYWTYDAPYLMRESRWLQFFTVKMIRTYMGSKVSIVDVRSADAFNQGHVPFALNIPAEEFKSHVKNPGKLAEIVGPDGLNVSDEAVVISGAGLNKDSALAFVMLEKLGQKRVSVYMDSMDEWAKLGYKPTKDATVVGPKKTPVDLSIPPTTYPSSLREGVIVGDAKSTKGVYPKVFIASGKDLPAKTMEGKVVHVPYTELVNADGTPKPAKDIWKVLDKAGVPRYAELICVSDDPGDAAVNYFILRLMGYPDIKVLAIWDRDPR